MAQSSFQQNIPFNDESPQAQLNHFRPIHYLGSKLRILEFLGGVLDELDPELGRVCDLFAGSGTVSNLLAHSRPVTAVDIQEYSRVLCSASLRQELPSTSGVEFISRVYESNELASLLKALDPLIKFEDMALAMALEGEPAFLCDLMEHGSLISYERGYCTLENPELRNALKSTGTKLSRIDFTGSSNALISRHFGGVYFSFKQTAHLDAILCNVNKHAGIQRDFYLAALLSTVSDSVNTVGKQFAQPLQPRCRNGRPKINLGERAAKDRKIEVSSLFQSWIEKYANLPASKYDHKFLKMDFSQALESDCQDFSIVYADPPYTRDHYSRFYHALETICLGDDPEISTTKIGGRLRLSRGLYRLERHQSPFCIRSQAPLAFESLFSKVAAYKKTLVLSYSPYDEEAESHPRVMTIKNLLGLGKKYFQNIDTRVPGSLAHSKLNHSEKNFRGNEFGEVLLVFT